MSEGKTDINNLDSNKLVPTEQIVPIEETSTRGQLVRRVRPDGKLVGDKILLITGAEVSGLATDPDFVQGVYARELIFENGKLKISPDNITFKYDPTLTVVSIGKIDYMDPENKEFFKELEGGKF